VIEVRQPSKGPGDNAEALLLGHSRNVCALDVDAAGKFIVSGAWDTEARVWPVGKWESQTVLTGHEGSVWAVLAFDADTVITACADKLIRIFNTSGKLIRRIQGSGAPVRALCRLPKGHASGADFASACNEGIIRLWTVSGSQVGELQGHESFIYSLAVTPSGEIVSSGEDRTLRIWKGNGCIQTITHPAISVWTVAVCAETGDIVSGASDRMVRVFTRSQDRAADAQTTRQFEDSVKASSIPQEQVGEMNKEKLPGPEFLVQKQGTKEGQVQMIKEHDGSVTAHTWSVGKEYSLVSLINSMLIPPRSSDMGQRWDGCSLCWEQREEGWSILSSKSHSVHLNIGFVRGSGLRFCL
jgi:phospholipase A-2-activating protein